jgi:hypothetical protein
MTYDNWEGNPPDLIDFMNTQRFFCSHLVALRNNSVESIVNLEEIWGNGAVLESEEPVKEGSRVEIRSGPAFFAGRIVQVERHEFGWRFEVEFSPMTPWKLEQFQPEHLLDVSELGKDTD